MNASAVAEPGILDEETGLERLSDWSDQEWEYQKKKARETAATQAALDAEPSRAAVDEALADLPDSAPDDLPPEEIIVAGLEMTFPKMGGKEPQGATLKLMGGKVKLQEGTALKKGMTIRFSGTAVVNFVGQKDSHDAATSQVVSAEQRHEARVTDLVISGF
jgi:hypothetical protein